MAPEKETIMVLKVDLQCSRCYKKVKQLLCKFPQIRDQVYDDKKNTVIIKVLCCSPERIRDKLCMKGGKSIQGIEIKEPPKKKPLPDPAPDGEMPPKTAPPPSLPATQPAKPPADKPKDKSSPAAPAPEKASKNGSKNGSGPKPDASAKPPEKVPEKPAKQDPMPAPTPEPGAKVVHTPPQPEAQPLWQPPVQVRQTLIGTPEYPTPVGFYPVNVWYGGWQEGQPEGSCYAGPQPVGDPYAYYYYGGGWNNRPGYWISRGDCSSDENPQACVIM